MIRPTLVSAMGMGPLSATLALLLYPAIGAAVGFAFGRRGEPRLKPPFPAVKGLSLCAGHLGGRGSAATG